MSPAVRQLPGSFKVWCDLSSDDELLRLLDVVTEALRTRFGAVTVAFVSDGSFDHQFILTGDAHDHRMDHREAAQIVFHASLATPFMLT